MTVLFIYQSKKTRVSKQYSPERITNNINVLTQLYFDIKEFQHKRENI